MKIIDWFLNDIFSLGLTFLHAMTLQSVNNLNNSEEAVEKIIQDVVNLGIYEEYLTNMVR